MSLFNKEEFWQYSQRLEIFHGLFTKLWQIGRPRFVDSIPTAAIAFDKAGNFIDFQFNKDFWRELEESGKLFIICHELLHVILGHGKRFVGLNKKIANVAADLVINESLINNFGFKKEDLQDYESFCWFDTVFPDDDQIPKDKNFEFYYQKLLQNAQVIDLQIVEGESGHDNLEEVEDGIKQEIEEILDSLSEEEKRKLVSKIEHDIKESKDDKKENNEKLAGSIAGSMVKILEKKKILKKRKWESIIKNWARYRLRDDEIEDEQWIKQNRRYASLETDVNLPAHVFLENENFIKNRIKVLMVMDSSGSTWSLSDRFFTAALSLPEERFDVTLCCFDTQFYLLTKNDVKQRKIFGGGGTDYTCVTNYYYSCGIKYDKVFTVTDGYFSYKANIKNNDYSRFYWFLTEGGTNHYIPAKCKTFDLKNFE